MIATNSAIETSRSTWTTESQEPVPTASMVLRYDPTNLRRRNLDATVNIDAKSRLDPPAGWPYKRPLLRAPQPGWADKPETPAEVTTYNTRALSDRRKMHQQTRNGWTMLWVFGFIWKLWACSFKWGMVACSPHCNYRIPSPNVEVPWLRPAQLRKP